MNSITKPLEELIRELPPELHAPVRESIELLLARHARRDETPDTQAPGPQDEVTLQEITGETVREICRLTDTLLPPEKYMVAPNALSIAQAYFEPKAWLRAVYAGETPVGFVMLHDDPEEQEYFLWRFMIAQPHHGKGFGRRAIERLVDYVRTRPGARVLETSCGQGPGSPEGFYRKVGFRRSGKIFGEEIGLVLKI